MKLLIFLIILFNINWQKMDYQELDWSSANSIKEKMKAKLLMNIEFNLSKVYGT